MEQASKALNLNMGCGYNHLDGYINVDRLPDCRPDQVADLESFPWPWPDNIAGKVIFDYSLTQMGATTALFLGIVKELYRICRNGAIVEIVVPHPRHDDFLDDPGNVRPITPQMLILFSRKYNDMFKENGDSNTPFAHYLGVDFDLLGAHVEFADKFKAIQESGQMSFDDIVAHAEEFNNVISRFALTLKVVKPNPL